MKAFRASARLLLLLAAPTLLAQDGPSTRDLTWRAITEKLQDENAELRRVVTNASLVAVELQRTVQQRDELIGQLRALLRDAEARRSELEKSCRERSDALQQEADALRAELARIKAGEAQAGRGDSTPPDYAPPVTPPPHPPPAPLGRADRRYRARQIAEARARINRGDFQAAERAYIALLNRFPGDAEVHLALAVLYDEVLGKPLLAAGHYQEYLRQRPDAADARRLRDRVDKLAP